MNAGWISTVALYILVIAIPVISAINTSTQEIKENSFPIKGQTKGINLRFSFLVEMI